MTSADSVTLKKSRFSPLHSNTNHNNSSAKPCPLFLFSPFLLLAINIHKTPLVVPIKCALFICVFKILSLSFKLMLVRPARFFLQAACFGISAQCHAPYSLTPVTSVLISLSVHSFLPIPVLICPSLFLPHAWAIPPRFSARMNA